MKRILTLTLSLLLFFPAVLPFSAAAAPGSYGIDFGGCSYGIARSGGNSNSYIPPVYSFTPQPSLPHSFPTPTPPKPAAPPVLQPVTPPLPQPPLPPPPAEPAGLNAEEKLLLDLVNAERTRSGIAPLQICPRLVEQARLKSREMIERNYFAHLSPTYGHCGDMLRRAEYPFSLAAENIGVGGNIRSIFNAFMGSPGHRSKILDARYNLTGIGICYQPGRGYLITQLFVRSR